MLKADILKQKQQTHSWRIHLSKSRRLLLGGAVYECEKRAGKHKSGTCEYYQ